MEHLGEHALALATLTLMEIVLGIDNIVFIAIITGKLPEGERPSARRIGLFLAMFIRVGLLLAISWVMSLTRPLFEVMGKEFTGKDLVLLLGGAFLIYKATTEIHHKLEGGGPEEAAKGAGVTFKQAVTQIVLLDIVFSLDSVITAVGMARAIWVMVTAVVISIAVMLAFAGQISAFVEKHPTVKMLALSFLLLIGVMLTADGLGQHIPKGYIYFAMAFSLGVEMLNLRLRKRKEETKRRRDEETK
ncbi:MAG: TerC family protein [Phycisphaerae bacterium]|nr:TerC family protein [Phycisphaerae bacterium]